MKTRLILAHPFFHASKANRALVEAVADLPGMEVADLYALYPDGQIDGEAEADRLLAADRLVLQFPMYWYSTPALLKQWQDVVLTPLFYMKPEIGARLAGRPLVVVVTTGGEAEGYRADGRTGFTVEELLRPLEATARRIGMIWETPFVVHDAREPTAEALALQAARYRSRLEAPLLAAAA
jgi:putative NADPH-quinone reductase